MSGAMKSQMGVMAPRRPYVAAAAVLLVFGLLALAVVFAVIDPSSGEVYLLFAAALLGFQTALSVGGIMYLRGVDATERRLLAEQQSRLEANLSSRGIAIFQGQIEASDEALDESSQTVSNLVVIYGMVNSAVILLYATRNLDPSNAQIVLDVAPKAFSATAYALLCGGVTAGLGRHVNRVFRHDWMAEFDRCIVGLDETQDESSGVDGLTGAIHEMRATLEVFDASREVDSGMLPVLRALGENLATLSADLESNRQAIQELGAKLDDKNEAIVQEHAAAIKEQTLELTRASSHELQDAARKAFQTLVKDFGNKHEELARKVFNAALVELTQKLNEVFMLLDGENSIGTRLRTVGDRLRTLAIEFGQLEEAINSSAAGVSGSITEFQEARAAIDREVSLLAEAIAELQAASHDPRVDQLVKRLVQAMTEVARAGRDLGAQRSDIDESVRKLDRMRQALARSRGPASGPTASGASETRVVVSGPSRER